MDLLKSILISTEIVYHIKNKKEKKKTLNKLVEERSFEFQDQKKIIILIIILTWIISPKDFSNYQNLTDLFINLRYCNINPKVDLETSKIIKMYKKVTFDEYLELIFQITGSSIS